MTASLTFAFSLLAAIESGSDKQQQSEAAEPQQQGRSTAEQLATGAAAGMTAAAGSVRSGLSKAYESLNAYTGGQLLGFLCALA